MNLGLRGFLKRLEFNNEERGNNLELLCPGVLILVCLGFFFTTLMIMHARQIESRTICCQEIYSKMLHVSCQEIYSKMLHIYHCILYIKL